MVQNFHFNLDSHFFRREILWLKEVLFLIAFMLPFGQLNTRFLVNTYLQKVIITPMYWTFYKLFARHASNSVSSWFPGSRVISVGIIIIGSLEKLTTRVLFIGATDYIMISEKQCLKKQCKCLVASLELEFMKEISF